MQTFAVQSPAMMIGSFVYAQSHPTNLYLLAGFTLSMAWGVATTCGAYAAAGFSMAVLEALVLTATATVGLTIYTLRSKQDFSYLGAGLGAGLWVLILGGLMAMFLPGMQLAMAIGGAAIFSLYIVYDVHMIATRLSPDECAAHIPQPPSCPSVFHVTPVLSTLPSSASRCATHRASRTHIPSTTSPGAPFLLEGISRRPYRSTSTSSISSSTSCASSPSSRAAETSRGGFSLAFVPLLRREGALTSI
eukprot:scaffold64686_cov32-Tisochrysis_lutea.AAC.2